MGECLWEAKLNECINNCPKQYPSNNQLRRDHHATIPKWMRRKRQREIDDYLYRRFFILAEEIIESQIREKCKDSGLFERFVNVNDLAFVDKSIYEGN